MNKFTSESVLFGKLMLGEDRSWRDRHELEGMCLYNEHASDSGQVLQVEYHLMGEVELKNFTTNDLCNTRWSLTITNENNDFSSFLDAFFNEQGFISLGTTKQGLLVEIKKKDNKRLNDFYVVIYGEKMPGSDRTQMYAHLVTGVLPNKPDNYYLPPLPSPIASPLYKQEEVDEVEDDMKFEMNDDLIETSLSDFEKNYDTIHSLCPKFDYKCHKRSAEEMMDDEEILDIISEDVAKKNQRRDKGYEEYWAQKQRKKQRMNNQENKSLPLSELTGPFSIDDKPAPKNKNRVKVEPNESPSESHVNDQKNFSHEPSEPIISKERPPLKSKASSSAQLSTQAMNPDYEAKKDTIKNVIKEEIKRQNLNTGESFFQQVYTGVKYTYRHLLKSSEPLELQKLKCIAKMHIEFYRNMDNIVAL